MLVQWKYKIIKKFAVERGRIVDKSRMVKIEHTKPYPDGFNLYRPTKRKYDYVDYTGRYKGVNVDFSDYTTLLEFFGYIKFIEKMDCDGRVFE